MGGILSKPKTPSVPKADIGKDISQYVEGYTEALPGLLQTEGEYRPQFMGLNLGDMNTFMQGTDSQMGLFGLSGLAQQAATQNLNQARQADMESYLGMAPQFRQFAQTLSPEAQAQVGAASDEAARATQAARGLSWEDKRNADQAAREAFASRGRLDDNASVFGEAMNRESVLSGKRAEAAGARGNAFNMAQQFYSAPGMGMMTAAPQAYNAGQQTLGMGLGAIGSATPQMINPDAGVNAGMAQRNAQANAAAAGAQAQAGHSAGMLGALGSIGGAIFSDATLKSDISPTGESTKDGIPVYIYRYHGGKQTYRGVMAQDVQRIRPDAVMDKDGYLAVDYTKL
jgi:hypothetical protein